MKTVCLNVKCSPANNENNENNDNNEKCTMTSY